jgi:hypothetical protein
MRTYDPHHADYYLLPLPVGGILTYGNVQDLQSAMTALAQDPIFQRYQEKFVLICLIEFLFLPEKKQSAAAVSGWSDPYLQLLENITVVKELDLFGRYAATSSPRFQPHDWEIPPINREISLVAKTWSLSYNAASDGTSLDLTVVDDDYYATFVNRTYHIFYHTTTQTSLFNSTWYRHAPVLVADQLTQPSSVGYDILASEWKRRFRDAKFV